MHRMIALPAGILTAILFVVGGFEAEAVAQMRLGGPGPAVLSPRPAAPLQSAKPKPPSSPQQPLHATIIDPGPVGAETTTNIYFAQVAVGGGFSTVFTLLNTGNTPVNGRLILRKSDGTPFSVNLTEPGAPVSAPDGKIEAVGTEFPLVPIPPGGTRILTASEANPGDPTSAGWARVENIGGSLGGVGTFQFVQGGVLRTIAGVLASQPVTVATIPVDDDQGAERFTGYAIANPNDEAISIRIVVVNEAGGIVTTLNPALLNPLGGQAQVARFLFQDQNPPPPSFKGSIVLISQGGQGFVVVALVQNRGLFTAIPVIPEKAPGIN